MYYLRDQRQDLSSRIQPVWLGYNDLTIALNWLLFTIHSSPFCSFPVSAFKFPSSDQNVHSQATVDLTDDNTASEGRGQTVVGPKKPNKSIM